MPELDRSHITNYLEHLLAKSERARRDRAAQILFHCI